jgi:hypothetical protein
MYPCCELVNHSSLLLPTHAEKKRTKEVTDKNCGLNESNNCPRPDLRDPSQLRQFIAGAIAGVAFLFVIGWSIGLLG